MNGLTCFCYCADDSCNNVVDSVRIPPGNQGKNKKYISYRPGWSQKQPKQVIYLYNTLSQHSMATYKFALSLKFFKRNFKATRSKVNDSSSSSKLGPLLTDLEILKHYLAARVIQDIPQISILLILYLLEI